MKVSGNGVPGAIGQGCRALLSGFEMAGINGAGEIRQSFGGWAKGELDGTAAGCLSAVCTGLEHWIDPLWDSAIEL